MIKYATLSQWPRKIALGMFFLSHLLKGGVQTSDGTMGNLVPKLNSGLDAGRQSAVLQDQAAKLQT